MPYRVALPADGAAEPTLYLQRRTLHGNKKRHSRRYRRTDHRLTRVLRRSQRFALCFDGSCVLLTQPLPPLQTCCQCRGLPPRRSNGSLRATEHVFHDAQHARSVIAVLEHGLRPHRRRGSPRRRRHANHADTGTQHGMDDTAAECCRGWTSGSGNPHADKFYQIKASK